MHDVRIRLAPAIVAASLGSLLALTACGRKGKPTDAAGSAITVSSASPQAPAPALSSSAAAAAAPAPDDEPETVVDPTQVPLPDDHEKRASKEIHEGNYKHALDQLEAK